MLTVPKASVVTPVQIGDHQRLGIL